MRNIKAFTIILILVFLIMGSVGFGMGERAKVSGIVFFKTKKLVDLEKFYVGKVGCTLWLDQGGCKIFKAGNMLFGFCQRDKSDMDALITFFYQTQKEVDDQYEKFKSTAVAPPKKNMKYRIYHFFARDPEGRMIEFQQFLDKMKNI